MILKQIYNNNQIVFIGGTPQYININLCDIYNNSNIPKIKSAVWNLSKYGEEEIILTKDLANKEEIIIDNKVITINLNYYDTYMLYGKFIHELKIIDINSQSISIILGKILIKNLILDNTNNNNKIKANYLVKFEPNGGNCEISSYSVEEEDYILLPLASKTNAIFKGWSKYCYGNDIEGKNGDSYYPKSDITLYALWTATKYTITFDANGGTYTTTSIVINSGDSIMFDCPTKVGYSFKGWFNKLNNMFIGNTNDRYMPYNDINLYAKWGNSDCCITFNANGGNCEISSKIVECGSAIALPSCIKEKFTFKGWYNSLNNGEFIGLNGNSYIVCNDITLYANWNNSSYIITFDANGGTCKILNKTVTYGETYGDLPEPTKEGYTFNGWYTATDNGTQILNNTNVEITQNITLYAIWVTQSYDDGTFIYNIVDNEAIIIGLKPAAKPYYGGVYTPATFNGYPVTAIANRAFYLIDIEVFWIRRTIKRIGDEAFSVRRAGIVALDHIGTSNLKIGKNCFNDGVREIQVRNEEVKNFVKSDEYMYVDVTNVIINDNWTLD